MKYSYSSTYNSSYYYKKLTPYTILADKPSQLFWVRNHGYAVAIAEFTKTANDTVLVTIRHLNGQNIYGNTTDLVNKHIASNTPTYIDNKAFLIMVCNANGNPNMVVMDYYSNTYNERKLTTNFVDVFSDKSIFTYTCINTNGSTPIVYHSTKGELDVDSFLLMQYFNDLSWKNKVQATADGTQFMSEYITRYYKLAPKSSSDFLYLNEGVNINTVVPSYIDTALVEDMFTDYLYPSTDKNNSLYAEENFYPNLSTVLYCTGLTDVQGVIPINNDMDTENVIALFATNEFLYIYIMGTTKKDLEKVKENTRLLFTGGVLTDSSLLFVEYTEKEAKELGYVTV